MHINKVISYNSAWQILKEKDDAYNEIFEAVSRINKELLQNPNYSRPPYRTDNENVVEITPFSFHRCWETLMEELGWGSYRMISDTPGGINIYVRNLKHRVATKMMASDRMMMFPNWLLVETPKVVNTEYCDLYILIVPMDSEKDIYEDPRRMRPHFYFEKCLAQLTDLLPLNQSEPFLVLGISSQATPLDIIEFEPNDSPNVIERVLEFPKEHYQAGIGILSYFGEIIKQKYPDIDVKVRIEQDGSIVRLIIDTPDGARDIIEKTLEDYALVVTNQSPPETLLEDKLQIHALSNKLSLAELEVRQTRDLMQISESHYHSRIHTLEDEVRFLKEQVGRQMHHMNRSQDLLFRQTEKEEKVMLAQIESSSRTVEELIQDAWNSAELRNALTQINRVLTDGATDNDEPATKEALITVRDVSSDVFEDLSEALKNTMYGVSGNIVFQWLQQIANLIA
ncbi:hypothetical protein [Alteromonas gracilis]|uniref:Uncharacterized protein n=1 Tax=Alteromonas gracilis TaxID=1479524 RepID=A0ABX5CNH1_9ALTE|nr:hypothetical protein [Alteromonas gracilis]PRO68980.1 hypothetical protein C6Y39_10505 [Alteromonas gracilis]